MANVSIRELRNHGGEVVDRVARGESLTVTRNGKPVAELRPVGTGGLAIAEAIRRGAHLPPVDPDAVRRDFDGIDDVEVVAVAHPDRE